MGNWETNLGKDFCWRQTGNWTHPFFRGSWRILKKMGRNPIPTKQKTDWLSFKTFFFFAEILVTFKPLGQSQVIFFIRRNSIIAHQWIGNHENLTCIRRICQGFRICHHASVENHFTGNRCGSTKGITLKNHRLLSKDFDDDLGCFQK